METSPDEKGEVPLMGELCFEKIDCITNKTLIMKNLKDQNLKKIEKTQKNVIF